MIYGNEKRCSIWRMKMCIATEHTYYWSKGSLKIKSKSTKKLLLINYNIIYLLANFIFMFIRSTRELLSYYLKLIGFYFNFRFARACTSDQGVISLARFSPMHKIGESSYQISINVIKHSNDHVQTVLLYLYSNSMKCIEHCMSYPSKVYVTRISESTAFGVVVNCERKLL